MSPFPHSRIAAKESIKMRDRHWGDRGYVTGTVGPRGDAYAFDASAAMTPDEAEEYHSRQERIDASAANPFLYRVDGVDVAQETERN